MGLQAVPAAGQPPLAGRAHLLGYRDDVPALLAGLDVLVVPSRQEPLSRVLLEGLALGVPAVATAVGGSPEILDDGRFGMLVPPDDPGAIARGIEELLGNQTLRGKYHQHGPERVRTTFTLERQVAAVRALYDRILL